VRLVGFMVRWVWVWPAGSQCFPKAQVGNVSIFVRLGTNEDFCDAGLPIGGAIIYLRHGPFLALDNLAGESFAGGAFRGCAPVVRLAAILECANLDHERERVVFFRLINVCDVDL
jgi:hypothetical protein